MAKYDYSDWEEYEEQAYREVIEPKKKEFVIKSYADNFIKN